MTHSINRWRRTVVGFSNHAGSDEVIARSAKLRLCVCMFIIQLRHMKPLLSPVPSHRADLSLMGDVDMRTF